MDRLLQAAKDYWTTLGILGGAVVSAYVAWSQIQSIGYFKPNALFIIGLVLFFGFTIIAVIKMQRNQRRMKQGENKAEPPQSSGSAKSTNQNGGVTVGQANIINYYGGEIQEPRVQEHQQNISDVSIDAPLPMFAPAIMSFTVTNKGSRKLLNCHAKLRVDEIHNRMFWPHPSNWYPKKIRWTVDSESGDVDLRPNEPEYLDVLELGLEHFRFLFHGDTSLSAGTYEPQNLNLSQRIWLSHTHYDIEIQLSGEDMDRNSIQVTSEFILSFRTFGNQNIRFDPGDTPLGIPRYDNNAPNASCRMSIKRVISKENISEYMD